MSDSRTELKTYSPPKLRKLAPEQAKLLLIGRATEGDKGARDLLDVLFPDSNEDERASPCNEREEPEGFVTRRPSIVFRLFLPALSIFESIGRRFRSLVRG
jgi:hypothetical protein